MISISAPAFDNETLSAVEQTIRSGKVVQGAKVQEFEESFANYIGTRFAIAVNSGTAALHLALLALGVKSGDEVITTPFSFIASSNAILYCGAKPVFVDIEPETFNIDASKIKAKLNRRTRAILPVHLFGQSCEIDKVLDICRENELALVEDACQSHGAEFNHKRVGSFGTGCFSFYATKNMTTGEGGMITTDSEEITQKCRLLRSHGQEQRYYHTTLGYNFRMTDIAASIGIGQLKRLDEFNRKRIENASVLSRAVGEIPGLKGPIILTPRNHVYHQFTVRVTEKFGLSRDEFKARLEERGISCGIHYPIPIHQQPLYSGLGYEDKLPFAEEASKQVLSLPVHPSLSSADLSTIVQGLRNG